ncbi:MAG: secondary thiamine-phosphate synthase enzyme YjbQ [Candidatus Aenigmatarchaeota archaeon]|nr:secondary thiamine-phosphate synthase enzyme YjbQ [Candidatus Aenigmarchaeota archaeon]
MPAYTGIIKLSTTPGQFYNISDKVQSIVKSSEIASGICIIFCPGSTGAIILNENDPTLLKDLTNVLENIASSKKIWHHADNAHSHIRASLLGPDVVLPVENGNITLGEWQSVLFYEADVKPRQRQIIVTIVGEFEED